MEEKGMFDIQKVGEKKLFPLFHFTKRGEDFRSVGCLFSIGSGVFRGYGTGYICRKNGV
jgi:hypothetical protein